MTRASSILGKSTRNVPLRYLLPLLVLLSLAFSLMGAFYLTRVSVAERVAESALSTVRSQIGSRQGSIQRLLLLKDPART